MFPSSVMTLKLQKKEDLVSKRKVLKANKQTKTKKHSQLGVVEQLTFVIPILERPRQGDGRSWVT